MRSSAFIGRWAPPHKGHLNIIRKVYERKKAPVLILVMDSFERWTGHERVTMMEDVLYEAGIPGKVMLIPWLEGVYYGRDVGYNVEEVPTTLQEQAVSATLIKMLMDDKDRSWEDLVAPGALPYLKTWFIR